MSKSAEYRLVVTGEYENTEEAKNALQVPFIEDFVEEKGRFRTHDLENIRVASGISLGDLEIAQIADETFEISCRSSALILNRRRIDELAETLRVYDIFDTLEIGEI
jgi:hypothetical protein